MRAQFLLALLTGCGFQIAGGGATQTDAGVGDALVDGGADDGSDASTDGSMTSGCVAKWLGHTISFAQPVALAELNTTSYDRDPFVSPDELQIWFSSGNASSSGGADVFTATRASIGDPFGPVSKANAFSTSGGYEGKLSITDSNIYAVVASSQLGGAGATDIWEVSRPNTNAAWGQLARTHVMSLETADDEVDPFITPDGLRLYYAPLVPAPQHIVVAQRATVTDNFGMPANVGGIELATSSQGDPTLFANDRVIVYYSDRPAANMTQNLWYATRAGSTGPFSTPILLSGVNSDLPEGDPHVSADGCRIYFSRQVGNGFDYDLFTASALP